MVHRFHKVLEVHGIEISKHIQDFLRHSKFDLGLERIYIYLFIYLFLKRLYFNAHQD